MPFLFRKYNRETGIEQHTKDYSRRKIKRGKGGSTKLGKTVKISDKSKFISKVLFLLVLKVVYELQRGKFLVSKSI
jgi:hypothetical protein